MQRMLRQNGRITALIWRLFYQTSRFNLQLAEISNSRISSACTRGWTATPVGGSRRRIRTWKISPISWDYPGSDV